MSTSTFSGEQYIEYITTDREGKPLAWDYKTQRNGHIECMECPGNLIWCKHIDEMIAHHGDAEQLWERSQDTLSVFFEIPIFPTANMWANIELTPVEKIEARKVFYYPPDHALTLTNDEIFVGFIHPSEGRFVIRSMILDWFTGVVVPSFGVGTVHGSLECRSSGHKFRQQMEWERAMSNAQERPKNLWAVWTTRSCLPCTLGSADDWDDLIPEVETRRPF